MAKCEKCGMEIAEGQTLCENCTKQAAEAQPATQPDQTGSA